MDRAEAERIVLSKGWLAGQAPAFRAALLRVADLLPFQKGDWVFRFADPPGGLYGVTAGSFGIYIVTPHAGPDLSHLLRPGWWFGQGPILGGRQRLFGVRAMEPSFALHLPLKAGRELVRDPEAARAISQIGQIGMQVAVEKVSDLMIRRADRRVCAVLLRVTDAVEDAVLRPTAEVRLTQSELARMANASRDLVNRTLARFEAAGWLRLGNNKLAVLDPEALADFAYARKNGRPAEPPASWISSCPGL
jgi:CRP-like cAMP-binding protein